MEEKLETLKELKDYNMVDSFSHYSIFGQKLYHYFYKGNYYSIHISYCKQVYGKTSWIVSYGTGDTLENYNDLGFVYNGYSRINAILVAKSILDRTKKA